MSETQSKTILLVEDNPADVRLTAEAFKEGGLNSRMAVAVDGAEALEFLFRRGKYVHAPRPDLVLLDLNLPRKGGLEVLAEVKRDCSLRLIPVIILTTSTAEEDIQQSYDLHANCYINKPIDMETFIAAVIGISRFWLGVVSLAPILPFPQRLSVPEMIWQPGQPALEASVDLMPTRQASQGR